MTRSATRQQEVVAVRSRLFKGQWRSLLFDVNRRMQELNRLFVGGNSEINRHIIVASIATLQTFHRGTIVSIVDHDQRYKLRAAQSINEKFSMQDALLWLTGGSTTFGELAAHLSLCNSVDDLMSELGNLLDLDMRHALSTVEEPYGARNRISPPQTLVDDVNNLLASLAETFRLRHIFAHEAAADVVVSAERAENSWASVQTWIHSVDALLWATVFAKEPLTQNETNVTSSRRLQEARNDLSWNLRLARKWAAGAGKTQWLRSAHRQWAAATQDWAQRTYGSLDGTMWPSVGMADTTETVGARIQQLKSWLNWQKPESDDWVSEWRRDEEARRIEELKTGRT